MPISISVGKEVLLVWIRSDLIMSFPTRTINKTPLNSFQIQEFLIIGLDHARGYEINYVLVLYSFPTFTEKK